MIGLGLLSKRESAGLKELSHTLHFCLRAKQRMHAVGHTCLVSGHPLPRLVHLASSSLRAAKGGSCYDC